MPSAAEAHSAASGVRLDALEVAEAVYLLVSRRFAVEHHRAVPGDELRLLGHRGVLETGLESYSETSSA